MIDLVGFRTGFPEFNTAPDYLVNSKLTLAAARLDAGVWGDRLSEGHGLLTAHLLALSPYGQANRLVAKDGTTTYGNQYDKLVEIVTCLLGRVAGT